MALSALRADDDQLEVGVFVGAVFVAGVDFDRVRVGRVDVGLGVARGRHRGPGVVAAGDVGAGGDVGREDHVDRAARLDGGDAGVAGPGEGGVGRAGRVVDDRPV